MKVFQLPLILFLIAAARRNALHLSLNTLLVVRARIAQSVQRLATGLDGPAIESRWGRNCPDRPWGPPSLLYNGDRVFYGGKAAGAWC
jgi:hypothetical protein